MYSQKVNYDYDDDQENETDSSRYSEPNNFDNGERASFHSAYSQDNTAENEKQSTNLLENNDNLSPDVPTRSGSDKNIFEPPVKFGDKGNYRDFPLTQNTYENTYLDRKNPQDFRKDLGPNSQKNVMSMASQLREIENNRNVPSMQGESGLKAKFGTMPEIKPQKKNSFDKQDDVNNMFQSGGQVEDYRNIPLTQSEFVSRTKANVMQNDKPLKKNSFDRQEEVSSLYQPEGQGVMSQQRELKRNDNVQIRGSSMSFEEAKEVKKAVTPRQNEKMIMEDKRAKEREIELERERERELREREKQAEKEREKEKERERQRLLKEQELEEQEQERLYQEELEMEKERERIRLQEIENKKQKQKEQEERERLRKQQELEKEREKERIRQQQEFEREKEKQRLRELEIEREKEKERERQRLIKEQEEKEELEEQERLYQEQLEMEKERERVRQQEIEKEKQKQKEQEERERLRKQQELEIEREKERIRQQQELEKQKEKEKEREIQREKQRQLEAAEEVVVVEPPKKVEKQTTATSTSMEESKQRHSANSSMDGSQKGRSMEIYDNFADEDTLYPLRKESGRISKTIQTQTNDLEFPSGYVTGLQSERVEISIPETKVVRDGLIYTYLVYKIVTNLKDEEDRQTEFAVYRRYSDFDWLFENITNKYHGYVIPVPPPKNILTAFNKEGVEFSETRKKELAIFLRKCMQHPFLKNTPELNIFLSDEKGFLDFKKKEQALSQNKAALPILLNISKMLHGATKGKPYHLRELDGAEGDLYNYEVTFMNIKKRLQSFSTQKLDQVSLQKKETAALLSFTHKLQDTLSRSKYSKLDKDFQKVSSSNISEIEDNAIKDVTEKVENHLKDIISNVDAVIAAIERRNDLAKDLNNMHDAIEEKSLKFKKDFTYKNGDELEELKKEYERLKKKCQEASEILLKELKAHKEKIDLDLAVFLNSLRTRKEQYFKEVYDLWSQTCQE